MLSAANSRFKGKRYPGQFPHTNLALVGAGNCLDSEAELGDGDLVTTGTCPRCKRELDWPVMEVLVGRATLSKPWSRRLFADAPPSSLHNTMPHWGSGNCPAGSYSLVVCSLL